MAGPTIVSAGQTVQLLDSAVPVRYPVQATELYKPFGLEVLMH